MNRQVIPARLVTENRRYAGTGGISKVNSTRGFIPAFRDEATGCVYPSCFSDGRRAPVHLYDGLPNELIVEYAPQGLPHSVRASVISGFSAVPGFIPGMKLHYQWKTQCKKNTLAMMLN